MGVTVAGYHAPANVLNLRYEDHPGLQVQASSLPLGAFLRFARMIDEVQSVDPGTLAPAEAARFMAMTDDLFRAFAGALRSWNLTDPDTDQPVPATYEALLGLDTMFAMDVMRGWMNAIGQVKAPLSNGSNGGGTSPEVSLPMEPLSGGLQN